jgi:hypothetical protein
VLLAIQLVPYGRGDRTNPPVVTEPEWDSPITRELTTRACFDCHSNETVWPVYTRIAPASWLIWHDVEEGRKLLNFSEWNRPYEEAGDAPEEVLKGEMPPLPYRLMHRMTRLSDVEQEALVAGIEKTLGLAK